MAKLVGQYTKIFLIIRLKSDTRHIQFLIKHWFIQIRTSTLTKFLSIDIKFYRLCADRENGSRQKHKALEFQRGKVMILQDSIAVNFTDRTPQIMEKVMVMANMERIILSPKTWTNCFARAAKRWTSYLIIVFILWLPPPHTMLARITIKIWA